MSILILPRFRLSTKSPRHVRRGEAGPGFLELSSEVPGQLHARADLNVAETTSVQQWMQSLMDNVGRPAYLIPTPAGHSIPDCSLHQAVSSRCSKWAVSLRVSHNIAIRMPSPRSGCPVEGRNRSQNLRAHSRAHSFVATDDAPPCTLLRSASADLMRDWALWSGRHQLLSAIDVGPPIFCTQCLDNGRLSSSSHHSGPPNSLISAEFLTAFFSCKFARIEHQGTKTGRENRNCQALQEFPNFSVCIQTVNKISATQSAKQLSYFIPCRHVSTWVSLSKRYRWKNHRVMAFERKRVAEE